jgi:putative membrane protein
MTGLSSFRLARWELRRFLRGRLTAAALVVICVIPLLYGALYLYAFWDPYGRLNHIPAALVMQDVPATASDGTQLHAGQDLADELIKRQIFDWHVTDERDAQEGLSDGTYQLALRIPRDFSANLTTGPDPDAVPTAARLVVLNDDATNYLSGVFSKTAFQAVREAAAQTAQATYFNKMLIGFTDVHDKTQEAANGAGKLDDGLHTANQGADRLNGGLNTADQGAGQLSGGLGAAARGADNLADGLVALRSGTAQLAAGTKRAAAGGKQLAGAVDSAVDRIEPALRENAKLIEDGANKVAKGADLLADNLDKLDSAADEAVAKAVDLQALLAGMPDETPGIDKARHYADDLVAAAKQVQSTIAAADLDRLQNQLHKVAETARKVADAAPHLADDIAGARQKVDDLADGLGALATGASQVNNGTKQAAAGAFTLRSGIYRLASGARELDGGLDRLNSGGRRLAAGLGDLQGGAAQLASGLSDGVDQIPAYGDDPQDRADLLSDPIALTRTVRHPAATYGVGFAPYFLSLALWVGAMITFMVLRPLNRRHIMSGAPAHRVVLASLLPAVVIGLAQALLLFVVVVFVLGLSPVHSLATLGMLLLTAAAFAAIMQMLGAALGPAGRILALALLMLQLTSSGGTYPVQTSPDFFQAIHPLLPMTYVVAALRHAIDGGFSGTVITGATVLLGFGLTTLVTTAVVARRSRRLSPSDLHPELVI